MVENERKIYLQNLWQNLLWQVYDENHPDEESVLQDVFDNASSIESALDERVRSFLELFLEVAAMTIDQIPGSDQVNQAEVLERIKKAFNANYIMVWARQVMDFFFPVYMDRSDKKVTFPAEDAWYLSTFEDNLKRSNFEFILHELKPAFQNQDYSPTAYPQVLCKPQDIKDPNQPDQGESQSPLSLPERIYYQEPFLFTTKEGENRFSIVVLAHLQRNRDLQDFSDDLKRREFRFVVNKRSENGGIPSFFVHPFMRSQSEFGYGEELSLNIYEVMSIISKETNAQLGKALLENESYLPLLAELIVREYAQALAVIFTELRSSLQDYQEKQNATVKEAVTNMNRVSLNHFLSMLEKELAKNGGKPITFAMIARPVPVTKEDLISHEDDYAGVVSLPASELQLAADKYDYFSWTVSFEQAKEKRTKQNKQRKIIAKFTYYGDSDKEKVAKYTLLLGENDQEVLLSPTLVTGSIKQDKNRVVDPLSEMLAFSAGKLERLLQALGVANPPTIARQPDLLRQVRTQDLHTLLKTKTVKEYLEALQALDHSAYPADQMLLLEN